MTKNEKKIYDKVGNQLKAREIITRRRWLIFLAIVAGIITWLGLWLIVLYFLVGCLMIAGFFALIDWLCGEDVNPYGRRDQPSPRSDDEDHESTSDMLWDLWFLDHWINHGKQWRLQLTSYC